MWYLEVHAGVTMDTPHLSISLCFFLPGLCGLSFWTDAVLILITKLCLWAKRGLKPILKFSCTSSSVREILQMRLKRSTFKFHTFRLYSRNYISPFCSKHFVFILVLSSCFSKFTAKKILSSGKFVFFMLCTDSLPYFKLYCVMTVWFMMCHYLSTKQLGIGKGETPAKMSWDESEAEYPWLI